MSDEPMDKFSVRKIQLGKSLAIGLAKDELSPGAKWDFYLFINLIWYEITVVLWRKYES